MSAGSGSPDERPREPFVVRGVPRSPTEIRNPTALIGWGAVVVVGGLAFVVGLFVAVPPPRPGIFLVEVLGFGAAFVLAGLFTVWVGVRRRQWLRDVAEWERRQARG